MSQKSIGIALVITGVVIVAASLLVDFVGLGSEMGIGWKQTAGLILGILIGAIGFIMRRGSAPK